MPSKNFEGGVKKETSILIKSFDLKQFVGEVENAKRKNQQKKKKYLRREEQQNNKNFSSREYNEFVFYK